MQKIFLNYDQQIEKLKNEKNLLIDNEAYAKEILKQTSYYSLIGGYKDIFKNPTTKKYKDGTRFEDIVEKMFDNVKREFIQENGLSNGDTTKRSDIFKGYQLSVSKDKRLSGTWTLEQYEGQYRAAMYAAVKSANPNWKPGQKFDTSILDNVSRESVESTLVKNGNRIVRNSIDASV